MPTTSGIMPYMDSQHDAALHTPKNGISTNFIDTSELAIEATGQGNCGGLIAWHGHV